MENKVKVIVVDDEERICRNVEKILQKQDYDVTRAASAQEALDKMAQDSYQLLISDIVMPGQNGLELLKLAKQNWPLTKAVMMTAYASTDTAMKAIRLGALDYLPKPFTPDELRGTVEKALSGEMMEVKPGPEEREAINVIDVDMPFDPDEVAKATGEGYIETLGRSDMPAAAIPSPETLEHYCAVGDMVCDIYKKLGATCKAGVKSHLCPQKSAKKKKSAGKKKAAQVSRKLIGVDLPFNYDEVVAVTGPEYVQNLHGEGVAFVPYDQVKERFHALGQKSATMSAMVPKDMDRLVGVDAPFDFEEISAAAGLEYAMNLTSDGFAPLPYEEVKAKFQGAAAADQEPAHPPVAQLDVHAAPILVIDDEVAVNNNIRKILAKKGFAVDQATTKKDALRQINEKDYAIALLDLKMPGVKGLELLQAIKDKNPETKVIIVTGYASIETAVEGARMGAVGYLPKPFTPDEIRQATGEALRLAA